MAKAKSKKTEKAEARPVLSMSHVDARKFFLKPESYCNIDLPPYFTFADVLNDVWSILATNELSALSTSPREHDDVNHLVLNNKDGKYAWRPMQLCHPALYVALVKVITEKDSWEQIRERFTVFAENPRIRCVSIPVESRSKLKDKAEQVSKWWHELEQRSIEFALDYDVLIHADVTDCYGAIYTHSIAWALHTKKLAKAKRKDHSLVGNAIDHRIQDMRNGQTNGIPQGSVLMDFIAEAVLGYADLMIGKAIGKSGISDYQILRYRDDYRIFAHSSQEGERILKFAAETLASLGLKLNTAKTVVSEDIVRDSIKADKLPWLKGTQRDRSLEKHLLIIHDHGMRFPNSGSLMRALTAYHRRVLGIRRPPLQVMALISIVTDIAYHNPKAYPLAMAILSKLLSVVDDDSVKRDIIARVLKRFAKIPNTGYLEIWLQRVALPFSSGAGFEEPLCQLVEDDDTDIWNSEWITFKKLKDAVKANKIIDRETVGSLAEVIPEDEIKLFEY